jgi:hypothetical protein
MASNFSVLSLKRNRSSSSSKGSKINTILNKLASPFHHDSKKRKQQFSSQETRKNNSFGLLFIDYFRSEENLKQNHPFANDALFEHNRYTTTKKQNNSAIPLKYDSKINIIDEQPKKSIITKNSNISSLSNKSGILVKQPPISFINNGNQKNHRHTNSTLSIQSSKSAYHHRKGKKSSHIRHYSHVSCMSASNITVNSENLTAKEFADIAGIRILSEDEEYSSSTFQSFNGSGDEKRIIKRCAFCDEADDDNTPTHSSMIVTSRYNDDMDYEEDENEDNYTSHSSPLETIQDDDYDLNIWDLNFWQQPGDDLQQMSSPQLHQNEEPPILHQLRRSNYNLSSNQQDTVIKKGRFEIHLSHCNHNNITQSTSSYNSEKAAPTMTRPDVVEWKRKKRPTTLKHQITA